MVHERTQELRSRRPFPHEPGEFLVLPAAWRLLGGRENPGQGEDQAEAEGCGTAADGGARHHCNSFGIR
jgi:hypothetical protein